MTKHSDIGQRLTSPRRRKSHDSLMEPAFDLTTAVNSARNGDEDDGEGNVRGKLDTPIKLYTVPSFLLAAWDGIYERNVPASERSFFPVGSCLSVLLNIGLYEIQSEPPVIEYRKRRGVAVADGSLPAAAKVALRGWLRKCSYAPPAKFGSTEDFHLRTTDQISSLLTGLGQELGVTKSALGVACLARGLADCAVSVEEHEALVELYDALVSEIAMRRSELVRRLNRARKGEE